MNNSDEHISQPGGGINLKRSRGTRTVAVKDYELQNVRQWCSVSVSVYRAHRVKNGTAPAENWIMINIMKRKEKTPEHSQLHPVTHTHTSVCAFVLTFLSTVYMGESGFFGFSRFSSSFLTFLKHASGWTSSVKSAPSVNLCMNLWP